MKMRKMSAAVVAVLCCSGLFLNSCMYEVPVYGGVSYSNGYGNVSAAAWTEASYDANGFPIYGYYYGRPVYGYTPEGVAIFTFAALTAACLVPLWAPAPWYHGHWHYPHHCHRVSAPPHFPHDHHPGLRPRGGMNAPIHKNPQSILHANRAPQPHGNNLRPNQAKPSQPAPNRGLNQPGVGRLEHKRRAQSNLPVFNPQNHRGQQPGKGHEAPQQQMNRPQVNVPQNSNHAALPSAGNTHHVINRPAGSPAIQMNHHASPSAPSISAPSRGGFGGGNAGHHGGRSGGIGAGHGGHHRR